MKAAFFSLLLLLSFSVIISCSKTLRAGNANEEISGRWNVVTDSVPEGIGPSAHINVYEGKSGDYYDFRADSNLCIKEGGDTWVYPYHLESGSILVIDFPDLPAGSNLEKFHIDQLGSSSLNLATGWLYTPGNIMGRAVHLSR